MGHVGGWGSLHQHKGKVVDWNEELGSQGVLVTYKASWMCASTTIWYRFGPNCPRWAPPSLKDRRCPSKEPHPSSGSMGHRRKEHDGQDSNGIKELEEAVRACGVSFQIRQNREPTGKPIPCSYDFTALSGKFKLQVMRKLPAKFDTILPDGLGPQVAQLWNISVS